MPEETGRGNAGSGNAGPGDTGHTGSPVPEGGGSGRKDGRGGLRSMLRPTVSQVAMAVLIGVVSTIATLVFMALAWCVNRRTQAWRVTSR